MLFPAARKETGVYDVSSTRKLAENKLILLCLIEKMGIPLSNSEICQFALEKNLMDYFSVQQYLSELVEANLIEKNKDNNNTRYTIKKQGNKMLSYFNKQIPDFAKREILDYIHENGKRIKAEYEVTANYFLEMNDEYLVKCGVYGSDGSNLMEFSVVVASKDQARTICSNWKKNVNQLYGSILSSLLCTKGEKEE